MNAKHEQPELMVQLTTDQLRGLISDAVRDAIANTNAAPVYMTLEQAAELLQVSPRTIRDRVRNEGLPAQLPRPVTSGGPCPRRGPVSVARRIVANERAARP